MDGNRSDNIVYDLSEYQQYNQDGSIKHIEMSTRLDFNENTHSVVMIGVSRNVTTQKIHQQELIETIKSQLILIKEFQVVDNDKPELQVYFFGKFRVLNSHVKKPIKWRTTKTEELFAFLIENDKPYVSKDKILESLWPDLGIEKAAKYLHTNTYNLKKDLKSAGISFQLELINGFYCYDVQNIHSDLAELRSMIKTVGVDYENFDDEEVDKIEQVILLYESDYLAENDYLWATSQSAFYRKQYEKYVFTLARYYFFKRNYPSTERVLCKLIEIDNFNENYHELLLQAYLFDQDYISFVDHYKELKALFLMELDQTPSPSIQGLYKKYQDSVEVSRNNKNVKTDL
ncbi:hypothetical protein ACIZ62_18665 [Acetobacterium carbinolicum]|uniref:AfsR/SARP family transcriptional regulator n=1 Tax=Acetobacterium carbinolicum TaxID=52690 RepID=UPI0039BFED23